MAKLGLLLQDGSKPWKTADGKGATEHYRYEPFKEVWWMHPGKF